MDLDPGVPNSRLLISSGGESYFEAGSILPALIECFRDLGERRLWMSGHAVINCYGGGCSILIWATNDMGSQGVLQKEEWIIFPGTRVATQSMKTEIKLRVHQLNLDVEDSEGKQWELPDHVQYHRFRQREAILCAIGSEKQEFPWQVCLSSPPAVSFCRLGCSPCHSSPSWFNMMDLFGKSFRWWEDRKRRKLTLDHKIKEIGLAHVLYSSFSSPSLLIKIICRKENGWLSDVIPWACWWVVQSTMERMHLLLSGLTWISRSGRKKSLISPLICISGDFTVPLCLRSRPSLPLWWSVPASCSWLLLSALWYTLFWALCVHLFSLSKSDIIYSHFQNVQLRFGDVRWSAQDHTAY